MKWIKRIKYILNQFDGLWSFPLAFIVFAMAGVIIGNVFGYGAGSYDPAFIQPLLLAVTVVIGATNAATIGIYFTFRGLYKFLWGQKDENGNVINKSKESWGGLTSWQKLKISFGVFLFYVSAILLVYLKLV